MEEEDKGTSIRKLARSPFVNVQFVVAPCTEIRTQSHITGILSNSF
jgi:hypothetical protein